MERTTLEQHLAQTERQGQLGAQHLRRQQALVERQEHRGRDATQARELLRIFQELQVEHVAHRERLLNALRMTASLRTGDASRLSLAVQD
jgi:hypothetical protein